MPSSLVDWEGGDGVGTESCDRPDHKGQDEEAQALVVALNKLGEGDHLVRAHRHQGDALYLKNCTVWKSHVHRQGGEAKGKTQKPLQHRIPLPHPPAGRLQDGITQGTAGRNI